MKNTKSKIILNPQDIRELKSKLHHLKPVVIVGSNGLTQAVTHEIDKALNDHELIKIRAQVNNREDLTAIADKICVDTQSTLLQIIGHIIAIYRKNPQTED